MFMKQQINEIVENRVQQLQQQRIELLESLETAQKVLVSAWLEASASQQLFSEIDHTLNKISATISKVKASE